jgi:hypothetical protein
MCTSGCDIERQFQAPSYLSAAWIEVNVMFSLDPRPLVTAMIATAIPAAIRPYSMAVAAVSSRIKLISASVAEHNAIVG